MKTVNWLGVIPVAICVQFSMVLLHIFL